VDGMSAEDVPELVRALDILLLPRGRAVWASADRAMALGVPVIATNVGGLRRSSRTGARVICSRRASRGPGRWRSAVRAGSSACAEDGFRRTSTGRGGVHRGSPCGVDDRYVTSAPSRGVALAGYDEREGSASALRLMAARSLRWTGSQPRSPACSPWTASSRSCSRARRSRVALSRRGPPYDDSDLMITPALAAGSGRARTTRLHNYSKPTAHPRMESSRRRRSCAAEDTSTCTARYTGSRGAPS